MEHFLSRKTKPGLPKFLRNSWPELLLSMLWILAILIVNPVGNFPLNDDWAYAKNVWYLSEQGVLKFSDWPAMTLLSQMLWGAAFCKVFGFSFTVLRISVILLGFIGMICFFKLMKHLSGKTGLSLFTTLVFCFNPLYFLLSFTFMTDVPFLVTIIIAFYNYFLYLTSQKRLIFIVFSLIFSILATLIRQTGIILPFVILIAHVLINRQFNRSLLIHFLTVFLVFLSLFFFIFWLKSSGNLSSNFSEGSELLKQDKVGVFLEKCWKRSYILLFYFGLFLLPFLVYIFKFWFIIHSVRFRSVLLFVSLLISTPVMMIWKEIPLWNILNYNGLGPKILKDMYWNMNLDSGLPGFAILILKVVSTCGSFLIIFYLLSGFAKFLLKNRFNKENFIRIPTDKGAFTIKLISLGLIAAYWIFLLLGDFFFDRYFIFLLPFFIALLIPGKPETFVFTKYLAFSLLVVYMSFSVLATHDYLSWNRARWKALNKLTSCGISPYRIDGGFEFNGWFETNTRNEDKDPGKSWWFVKDDEYLISSGNFCGYRKIEKYLFTNYLGCRTDSLFILKRIDDFDTDTLAIFCDAESSINIQAKKVLKTNEDSLFCECFNTLTIQDAFSGQYALKTNNQSPFAFTINLKGISPCETIKASVWTKFNKKNAAIVVSSTDAKDLYYTGTVKDTLRSGSWKYIELVVRRNRYMPDELKFYVWNPTEQLVLFDDLKIEPIIPSFSIENLSD